LQKANDFLVQTHQLQVIGTYGSSWFPAISWVSKRIKFLTEVIFQKS
jgi:hypothetical protein